MPRRCVRSGQHGTVGGEHKLDLNVLVTKAGKLRLD